MTKTNKVDPARITLRVKNNGLPRGVAALSAAYCDVCLDGKPLPNVAAFGLNVDARGKGLGEVTVTFSGVAVDIEHERAPAPIADTDTTDFDATAAAHAVLRERHAVTETNAPDAQSVLDAQQPDAPSGAL